MVNLHESNAASMHHRFNKSIEPSKLPNVLKNKSAAERKTYVTKQKAKRRQLERKMAELVKKRDKFVSTKRVAKAAPDSFDEVVSETLKEQFWA